MTCGGNADGPCKCEAQDSQVPIVEHDAICSGSEAMRRDGMVLVEASVDRFVEVVAGDEIDLGLVHKGLCWS